MGSMNNSFLGFSYPNLLLVFLNVIFRNLYNIFLASVMLDFFWVFFFIFIVIFLYLILG